jgi:hypothetical protein
MPLNKLSLDKDVIGPPPGIGSGGGGGGSGSEHDINVQTAIRDTGKEYVAMFEGEPYQKIDVKSVSAATTQQGDATQPIKIEAIGVRNADGSITEFNPNAVTVHPPHSTQLSNVQVKSEDVGVVQVPPPSDINSLPGEVESIIYVISAGVAAQPY